MVSEHHFQVVEDTVGIEFKGGFRWEPVKNKPDTYIVSGSGVVVGEDGKQKGRVRFSVEQNIAHENAADELAEKIRAQCSKQAATIDVKGVVDRAFEILKDGL